MTDLVIVESPAKAKTIEGYLGKGFKVASSFGHIRDLQKKEMGVDKENGFQPIYEVSAGSKKQVVALKKLVKTSNLVWLATDEDREGEAIAWHLYDELKLTPEKTRRITFNEITKSAVLYAVDNPRAINTNLVNAQQARRVIDRLVGFELSPVLWRKVRTGLSAGRVQSVAVRLVMEREKEIEQFTSESSFEVRAQLYDGKELFEAVIPKKIAQKDQVKRLLEQIPLSGWRVQSIERKEIFRTPPPPLTTSSLQQLASSQLGFSVKRTMSLAQRLYEAGHISYMRTDSVHLSERAQGQIKQFVENKFGAAMYFKRAFKVKSASAQEAHEAIRPVHFKEALQGVDPDEGRLYSLIFKRTVASQMEKATISKTTVSIMAGDELFTARGEEIINLGFLQVTGKGEKNTLLPNLVEGQLLEPQQVVARQGFSRPPARYSEAKLVQKLEELGIGRPSTYAPTISTIQERGYVVIRDIDPQERVVEVLKKDGANIQESTERERFGGERARMAPTPIAELVTVFLQEHFSDIVDYHFTAKLEGAFDAIAQGNTQWNAMVGDFYGSFHPLIEEAEKAPRPAQAFARYLGDGLHGKPVYVKMGRYGAFVQLGEDAQEGQEKPQYASLDANQNIDTIELEEALKLLKLPRTVGVLKKDIQYTASDGTIFQAKADSEVIANKGRFGPYLQYGSKQYVSLKKTDPPPESILMDQALTLIEDKVEKDAKNWIAAYGDKVVKKGPYGIYLKVGRKNHKISKDFDPYNLTSEDIEKIINSKSTQKTRSKKK